MHSAVYFSSPFINSPFEHAISFPVLIRIVQGLIASLVSSFLFSELWIVLTGLPVVCTLTCFSGQSWPPMQKASWNYVYLFFSAASFPIFLGPLPCSHTPGIICTWRLLPRFPVYNSDFQVYLQTSIYFSDKGSNIMLLSPLRTDLCVIFTRTRPDCLLLKGQCLQNESRSTEDRRLISSKYLGNGESGGTKLFIEKRKKSRAGRLYV